MLKCGGERNSSPLSCRFISRGRHISLHALDNRKKHTGKRHVLCFVFLNDSFKVRGQGGPSGQLLYFLVVCAEKEGFEPSVPVLASTTV
jgi:hypothetical protein